MSNVNNNKKNIIYQNPLLSSSLIADDLIKDAVLLRPVTLPEEVEGDDPERSAAHSQSPNKTGIQIAPVSNSNKRDSNVNVLNTASSLSSQDFSKSGDRNANLRDVNLSKEDDFDFASYYARVHSIPDISSSIAKQCSKPKQENPDDFAEIDLRSPSNDDDYFPSSVPEGQSYASDFASNLSQLPNVLPHVANTVFSSFSSIWNKGKIKNEEPLGNTEERDFYNQHKEVDLTVRQDEIKAYETIVEGPIEPVPLLDASSYSIPGRKNSLLHAENRLASGDSVENISGFCLPPVVASSPSTEPGSSNIFRISSSKSKKMYAKVPGLTLGETGYEASPKPSLPLTAVHLPPLPVQQKIPNTLVSEQLAIHNQPNLYVATDIPLNTSNIKSDNLNSDSLSNFSEIPMLQTDNYPTISTKIPIPTFAPIDVSQSPLVPKPTNTSSNTSNAQSTTDLRRETVLDGQPEVLVSQTLQPQNSLPPRLKYSSNNDGGKKSYNPHSFFGMLKKNSPLKGPDQTFQPVLHTWNSPPDMSTFLTSPSIMDPSQAEKPLSASESTNTTSTVSNPSDAMPAQSAPYSQILECKPSVENTFSSSIFNQPISTQVSAPQNVSIFDPLSQESFSTDSSNGRKFSNVSNVSENSLDSAMSKLNTSEAAAPLTTSIPPPLGCSENKFRLSANKRLRYYTGPISGDTAQQPHSEANKSISNMFVPGPPATVHNLPVFTPNMDNTFSPISEETPDYSMPLVENVPQNLSFNKESSLESNVPSAKNLSDVQIFTPLMSQETRSYTPSPINKPEIYSPERHPYLPENPLKHYHTFSAPTNDICNDNASNNIITGQKTESFDEVSNIGFGFKAFGKIQEKINLSKIQNVMTSLFDPNYYLDQKRIEFSNSKMEDFSIQTDNSYNAYPLVDNQYNVRPWNSVPTLPDTHHELTNSQFYAGPTDNIPMFPIDLSNTNLIAANNLPPVFPAAKSYDEGHGVETFDSNQKNKIHSKNFEEIKEPETSGDEKRLCLESPKTYHSVDSDTFWNSENQNTGSDVSIKNDSDLKFMMVEDSASTEWQSSVQCSYSMPLQLSNEEVNKTNAEEPVKQTETLSSGSTEKYFNNILLEDVDKDGQLAKLPQKDTNLSKSIENMHKTHVFDDTEMTSESRVFSKVDTNVHDLCHEFEPTSNLSIKKPVRTMNTIHLGDATTFFDRSDISEWAQNTVGSSHEASANKQHFFRFEGSNSKITDATDPIGSGRGSKDFSQNDFKTIMNTVEINKIYSDHISEDLQTESSMHFNQDFKPADMDESTNSHVLMSDNHYFEYNSSFDGGPVEKGHSNCKYKTTVFSQEIQDSLPLLNQDADCIGEYYEDQRNIWGFKNVQIKETDMLFQEEGKNSSEEDDETSFNDEKPTAHFKPVIAQSETKIENISEAFSDNRSERSDDCNEEDVVQYKILDDSFNSFTDDFLNEVAEMIDKPTNIAVIEKNIADGCSALIEGNVEDASNETQISDDDYERSPHDRLGEIDSELILNIMKNVNINLKNKAELSEKPGLGDANNKTLTVKMGESFEYLPNYDLPSYNDNTLRRDEPQAQLPAVFPSISSTEIDNFENAYKPQIQECLSNDSPYPVDTQSEASDEEIKILAKVDKYRKHLNAIDDRNYENTAKNETIGSIDEVKDISMEFNTNELLLAGDPELSECEDNKSVHFENVIIKNSTSSLGLISFTGDNNDGAIDRNEFTEDIVSIQSSDEIKTKEIESKSNIFSGSNEDVVVSENGASIAASFDQAENINGSNSTNQTNKTNVDSGGIPLFDVFKYSTDSQDLFSLNKSSEKNQSGISNSCMKTTVNLPHSKPVCVAQPYLMNATQKKPNNRQSTEVLPNTTPVVQFSSQFGSPGNFSEYSIKQYFNPQQVLSLQSGNVNNPPVNLTNCPMPNTWNPQRNTAKMYYTSPAQCQTTQCPSNNMMESNLCNSPSFPRNDSQIQAYVNFNLDKQV